MPGLFDKLNLKDQREIFVVNAPASFAPHLRALKNVRVQRHLGSASRAGFVLAFATRKTQVDSLSRSLIAKAEGDAVIWFAYPKGTSKNFSCDFNRDNGWDIMRAAGFDSVRQVAIDADWSALRFRRLEYIHR